MSSLLRKSLAASVCLLSASLLQTAHSQTAPTPAARIDLARALYYTPTRSGLKSFHCDVAVDWKGLMARFGAGDLPATDPHLVYLNSVKLSLDDDLTGAGSLTWAPPVGADAEPGDIGQIRGGMLQMIGGFFQTWNPFINGQLIPVLDATTTAKPESDGLIIQGGDKSTTVTEHFDKNMLLTEMHVTSPESDVTARPVYTDTPNGRIVASIKSELHQPPTAPALTVTMAATYAPVSTYQLPSTLTFSVQNVGDFNFKLSGCKVNTPPPTPAGVN